AIAAHPNGKFLYVTAQGILGYTIDSATGGLTPIAGSPFPFSLTGTPSSLAVDPSGNFAYAVTLGNDVSGYTIDPTTGALTLIVGSPFHSTAEGQSVAVDPNGGHRRTRGRSRFALCCRIIAGFR